MEHGNFIGMDSDSDLRGINQGYKTAPNVPLFCVTKTHIDERTTEYEILKVKMNDEVFSVGDTVIHNDGSYAVKIVKFALADLTPPLIWFYDQEGLKYVKDLSNFRKITVDDISVRF